MNTLYYGDNLDVMRRYVKDESVDLIYLDPPFNSKATYNMLFEERDGTMAAAQIKAFDDNWRWDISSEKMLAEIYDAGGPLSRTIHGLWEILGKSDMLAYLVQMGPRLEEMHRVLKDTGSIYLHCDPAANSYLRILMDSVFGPGNFRNEIVWHYTGGGRSKKYFSRKHDTVYWYAREDKWIFNIDAVRVPYKKSSGYARSGIVSKSGKRYMPHPDGTPVDSVWDIPIINPLAKERLGYPTQKPIKLLERIIKASSNEGDVVMDPFCGCGTAVIAAEQLNREWIGIDVTHLSVALMKHRLIRDCGTDVEYRTIGEPTTFYDAETLAGDDPFQFQAWALGLVGARPEKIVKGADRGIDGTFEFVDDDGGAHQAVISVKAGRVTTNHLRDLRGVMTRDGATLGIFISLNEPTRAMRRESAEAGLCMVGNYAFPKMQLLTIKELLDGKSVDWRRG